ncbi:hypothetical protein EIL50_01605 [bacterium NHP-B]|nr:hypothetical protein EIL50_01605 [bacterium NHP-B]
MSFFVSILCFCLMLVLNLEGPSFQPAYAEAQQQVHAESPQMASPEIKEEKLVSEGEDEGREEPLESRIVFVVGDRPVFVQEFNDRVNFVLLITGSDPSKTEKTPELYTMITKGMIDEILQLKATKDAGIEIGDAEIDEAINRLAKGNGMTRQEFEAVFTRSQVPMRILKMQIKAQMAWGKYIQQKYVRDMLPTQKEIDLEVQRLKVQKGKTEYRLAEISMYTHGRTKSELFPKMEQVVRLLQQGAPFPMVARQFSEGRSAMEGGYLGWLQEEDFSDEGEFAPEILAVVEQTPVRGMTPPIETSAGYRLFVLLEKRKNSGHIDLDTIEKGLQQNRFELASRKELARLQKATMIQHR